MKSNPGIQEFCGAAILVSLSSALLLAAGAQAAPLVASQGILNALTLVQPAPVERPSIEFDVSRSIAAGRITARGDTQPLRGEVVDNEDGTLTIFLRDFRYGLAREDGLTSRLNLRTAVPVEILAGHYPASLEVTTVLRLDKGTGSSVAAALDATLLAAPAGDTTTLRWADGERASGDVTLSHFAAFDDDAAKKEFFCAPGLGRGVLVLNFALSGERPSDAVGAFAFRPAEGDDLAIVVKPGVAKSCR